MLILNSEPVAYSRKAYKILSSIGTVIEKECNRESLLDLIPEVDVLIVRLGNLVDQEVFFKAKKLKIIVTATTGLNHIDLEAAAANKVIILSLKGERQFLDTLTATAELTWGLLLALVRKLPQAINHVANAGWNRDQFKGSQLKGKTLGIIGYGRLGSIVAEYGKAFQMHVIIADPYVDSVASDIRKVTMDELLSNADVISLHVNYDKSTHGLIDEQAFLKIKPGAVFINTSRGELVNENAMLNALDTGVLSGIALDVLANEAQKTLTWPEDSLVWQKSLSGSNILIAPHIGGGTYESMEDTEVFMANKLCDFIKRPAN